MASLSCRKEVERSSASNRKGGRSPASGSCYAFTLRMDHRRQMGHSEETAVLEPSEQIRDGVAKTKEAMCRMTPSQRIEEAERAGQPDARRGERGGKVGQHVGGRTDGDRRCNDLGKPGPAGPAQHITAVGHRADKTEPATLARDHVGDESGGEPLDARGGGVRASVGSGLERGRRHRRKPCIEKPGGREVILGQEQVLGGAGAERCARGKRHAGRQRCGRKGRGAPATRPVGR
jgi:hypothetical protein